MGRRPRVDRTPEAKAPPFAGAKDGAPGVDCEKRPSRLGLIAKEFGQFEMEGRWKPQRSRRLWSGCGHSRGRVETSTHWSGYPTYEALSPGPGFSQ